MEQMAGWCIFPMAVFRDSLAPHTRTHMYTHTHTSHRHMHTRVHTHTHTGSCSTAVTSFIFSGETATWGDVPRCSHSPGVGHADREPRAGRSQEGRLAFPSGTRGAGSANRRPCVVPPRPGLPGESSSGRGWYAARLWREHALQGLSEGSAPRRHRRRAP